jgi:hypothetical protein
MPAKWAGLNAAERKSLAAEVRRALGEFSTRQTALQRGADAGFRDWFVHAGLASELVTWRLEFLSNADRIAAILKAHDVKSAKSPALPPELRQQLVTAYQAIEDSSARYNRSLAAAPGKMMAHVVQVGMTAPWLGLAERLVGMEWYSHAALSERPMSGQLEIEAPPIEAGKEFIVRCRVRNTGFYPWSGKTRPRLSIDEAAKPLALHRDGAEDEAMVVYGDEPIVEFRGVAPAESGEVRATWTLAFPEGLGQTVSKTVLLKWTAP